MSYISFWAVSSLAWGFGVPPHPPGRLYVPKYWNILNLCISSKYKNLPSYNNWCNAVFTSMKVFFTGSGTPSFVSWMWNHEMKKTMQKTFSQNTLFNCWHFLDQGPHIIWKYAILMIPQCLFGFLDTTPCKNIRKSLENNISRPKTC